MGRRADPRPPVLRGVELPERYELVRRVASGGMASVWCARDRTLDRPVAIKLLSEPYAHDEVAVRRFKREARTAARMSGHPNVVTIYDVGQAAPSETLTLRRPFIVMEYLAAGTVADALRVGEADRAATVRWLHEAAAALDHAHRQGVIHRDVKLANFLLDGNRTLHVADFGIAQVGTEDTLTATGQVMGTAAYLAPERALGQSATEASDRYSLAVAAFELLVGERPFAAENFTAVARSHVEKPPPRASHRNPALPRGLDAVLARGMAKRPEQRFKTASDLADAVDRALGGRRAPRRAVAAGSVTSSGRGRVAAIAAVAATALAVGIAAGSSHTEHVPNASTIDRARTAGHGSLRHPTRPRSRPHRASTRPPTTTTTPPPTTTTTTTTPPPTTSPTPPTTAAPPAPPSPDALEAQGHQLMLGGNYDGAIPVLRRAVAGSSPASLTYAYALFDLGRSLRLAGDPQAAVPILWRRLQIPDQTGVVRAELTLALRALGRQSRPVGHGSH